MSDPRKGANDAQGADTGTTATRTDRAVEVLTLFEDAIIDARHFDDPSAGRTRQSTRALIAGGLTAITLALVLFLIAYAQVVSGRAAGAVGGGAFADWAALLLLVGGGAGLLVGLGRRLGERRPRDFTIGEDPRALVHASVAPLADADRGDPSGPGFVPLLHSTGDDYELCLCPRMGGDITMDADAKSGAPTQRYAIGALIEAGHAKPMTSHPGLYTLPLPEGARAAVEIGEITVLLRRVDAPKREPVPLRLDASQLRYTLGTAGCAALVLGLLFAIPPDSKSLALERLDDIRHLRLVMLVPKEIPEPPPVVAKTPPVPEKNKDTRTRGGTLASGTRGKMGDERSHKAGRFSIEGPKDNQDLHLAKNYAADLAAKSGILGVLRADQGSPLASMLSTHDSALGDEATTVLGNLVGTEVGDGNGVPGGLWIDGHGVGGPRGPGLDTVGFGPIGTISHAPGGDTYGKRVALRDRPHTPASVSPVSTGTSVAGGIDKEIIRRVIRRHINEIKFCYDQALLRDASLYGRVLIQFSIAPDGHVAVASVASSTLQNREVEQCAAGAVRRWEFPRPEHPSFTNVTYPFAFNRAGE